MSDQDQGRFRPNRASSCLTCISDWLSMLEVGSSITRMGGVVEQGSRAGCLTLTTRELAAPFADLPIQPVGIPIGKIGDASPLGGPHDPHIIHQRIAQHDVVAYRAKKKGYILRDTTYVAPITEAGS